MHLDNARRLLDELAKEAIEEQKKIKEEEEREKKVETISIPSTEDWESEANHSPSALPITRVNWDTKWCNRCVCGARPGKCQH